jgi:hypothetical protein
VAGCPRCLRAFCDDGPACIDWQARLKNGDKPDPENAWEVDNFIMHLHRAAKLKKRMEEAREKAD